MKKILQKIFYYLKSNENIILNFIKSKIFAYILVILFMLITLKTCQNKKNAIIEKTKIEQNLIASNDTAKYYKNKFGELVIEKTILILSEKELKKGNKELYDIVHQQNGNIISLNTAIISLKQDTSILRGKIKQLLSKKPTQLNDSTWDIYWNLEAIWDKTNFDKYSGKTTVGISGKIPVNNMNELTLIDKGTELLSRESNIGIKFGEKVVDGLYNVYLISKYPGLSTTTLEGVFIDPNTNNDIKRLIKKQHWFTGFSVGVSVTPGYNLVGGNFGFVVGPSLTWNIYNW